MKSLLATLGIFAAVTVAALPARADEYSFKRTLDTTVQTGGATALAVAGDNGNIHLYADGGSTVRIHAVLGARTADVLKLLDVSTSREGSTLRVQDVCPTTRHLLFWSFADCNIELDVHYPRSMPVSLHSTNGNVAIDGAGAAVSLENANGNVHVDDARGAVSIKNSNGNLTVDGALANVSASNGNGNVDVALDPAWHGSAIALSTHAGNVDLRVPRGFQAKLNAKTRLGDVRNSANLQNGPVTVTASTTFGNVYITRE